MAENTAKGQNVGAPVEAEDPETDTITYTLEGTDASSFTIVLTSGQIKTNVDDLDYETKNSYSVTVRASDGTNEVTLDVTINVAGANETPTIAGDLTPEHPENSVAVIETYVATDEENNSIAWDVGGTDAGHFAISNAGLLTFDPAQNYEDPSDDDGDGDYVITIQAFDGNTTGEIDVTVTLTNVNEPPIFTRGETTIDYVEGDTSEVENYDAEDPEGSIITWDLIGTDADDLSINQTGGVTFLSPPDYDDPNTDNVYEVTVVARDSANNEATLDLTVNVTPVNDPPVITYNGNTGDQTIPYAENGTGPVGTFVATDQENNSIEWKKSGDDEGKFNLSNAGVLSFIATPDYENPTDKDRNRSYLVTVEAFDGTNSDTINVTVNVTPVDENPVVTGDTGPSVVEGSADTFATYSAQDPEEETITWEEPSGDDGNLFEITTDGKLSFKASPDFETPGSANNSNVYQVTVNAGDGTTSGTLDVTVTVVDDNETIIREGTWTAARDYPENSDSTVATYAARDPEGENIDWDLSGDDDDKLSISNAGVLTFNTVPDFEVAADHNTDKVYEITVIASDGENQETQDVRITITNVNEAPVLTVVEEVTFAEGGTGTVTTFVVTDPDANTTITWSLTGDDAGDFNSITKPANEPLKGALTFVNAPDKENAADADTNNDYEITVKATDEGGLYDEMEVTIEVQDEDETPLLTGVTAKDWKENDTTAVATYNADDPENDPITWTLEGEDRLLFTITGTPLANSEDANLSFNAAPDFEDKKDHDTDNEYEVTIKATDDTHTQTLDVVIKVTDVNETPVIEVLAPEPYAENGTGDVANFSATDPDDG